MKATSNEYDSRAIIKPERPINSLQAQKTAENRSLIGLVCGEKPTLKPSRTIPNQAMSLREILNRYQRGILPERQPIYFDDDILEGDFEQIDPTLDPAFDLADASQIQAEIVQHKTKADEIRKEHASDSLKAKADTKGGTTETTGESD